MYRRRFFFLNTHNSALEKGSEIQSLKESTVEKLIEAKCIFHNFTFIKAKPTIGISRVSIIKKIESYSTEVSADARLSAIAQLINLKSGKIRGA